MTTDEMEEILNKKALYEGYKVIFHGDTDAATFAVDQTFDKLNTALEKQREETKEIATMLYRLFRRGTVAELGIMELNAIDIKLRTLEEEYNLTPQKGDK